MTVLQVTHATPNSYKTITEAEKRLYANNFSFDGPISARFTKTHVIIEGKPHALPSTYTGRLYVHSTFNKTNKSGIIIEETSEGKTSYRPCICTLVSGYPDQTGF